jgi:hypothetical protein
VPRGEGVTEEEEGGGEEMHSAFDEQTISFEADRFVVGP